MKRLLLALALFMSGCIIPKPPTPTPSPYYTAFDLVACSKDPCGGIPQPIFTISGYNHNPIKGNQDGYVLMQDLPKTLTDVTLTVNANGYKPLVLEHQNPANWKNATTGGHNVFVLQADQLPKLGVTAGYFTRLGQPYFLIETSDFDLYGQYLRGVDINPVLQQRKDLGFRSLRIFTQYDITLSNGERLINLDPQYPKLRGFLDMVQSYGFYVDLTAYTGPYTWGYSTSHWTNLCNAVQGTTNVILSLVNENDQIANKLDPTPFAPCPGILSSRGTSVNPAPGWMWYEEHTNSQSEWQRKAGHNTWEDAKGWSAMLGQPLAGHTNENKRYTDQDNSLVHVYDAFRACAMFVGGCTYHSIHGRDSQFFTGDEYNAAKQAVLGAQSAPSVCLTLPYVHGASEVKEENWKLLPNNMPNPAYDPHRPSFLRVYQFGNNPSCRVQINY